jgi:hypothetical protein
VTKVSLTEKQLWKLCDANGCDPVPLDADSGSLKSFVYDRKFGVIRCPFGSHPSVMSLLLAWHHGCKDGIEVSEFLGLEYSSGTADSFLKLKGTAFRSSQASNVEASHSSNLEDWELAYLGKIRFIE